MSSIESAYLPAPPDRSRLQYSIDIVASRRSFDRSIACLVERSRHDNPVACATRLPRLLGCTQVAKRKRLAPPLGCSSYALLDSEQHGSAWLDIASVCLSACRQHHTSVISAAISQLPGSAGAEQLSVQANVRTPGRSARPQPAALRVAQPSRRVATPPTLQADTLGTLRR